MSDVTVTSSDGTKLAARHAGTGTPIVLVHGALGNVDTFLLVEPLLADRHEVWTYSRRGYPGSDDAHDCSPTRNVDDLWAVVEAAGGRAHLCGWSSGAMLALGAAQGATSLRSVILYEPPLNNFDAEAVRGMLAALEPVFETGGAEAFLETFFPAIGEPEDAVAALRANTPVWERLKATVPGFLGELRAFDVPADAPPPQPPDVPTLYLYGADTSNPIFPTPDVVASVLPAATLRALPGQRHLAPWLDPAGFAAAILEFTSALDA